MITGSKKQLLYYSFIAVLVFVGVVLGHLFILPTSRASIVWPALGLVFAFRYSVGRKVMPYLILGYFVGYFFSGMLVSGIVFYLALIIAIVMTGFLILATEIAMIMVKKVNYKPEMSLNSALRYMVIALVVAIFTSITGSLFYASLGFFPFNTIISSTSVWILGDFFSIVSFGLPVIYSIKFDRKPNMKNTVLSVIVYGLFIVIVIGLLSNQVYFLNFRNHKFILVIFVFVLAFYLPYYTIYLFHIILLTAMIVFSPFDGIIGYLRLMMEVNLFLALMTLTTITIKYHMHAVASNKDTISDKAKRLDLLLDALDNLLTMPSESNKLKHHDINDHLKDMFHMVYTLFGKADYGSCMIFDDTIQFIDGIGFDIDVLNSLSLKRPSHDAYHLDEPYIQSQAETFLKKDLGNKDYQIYENANPAIKESLYVGFRISKDIVCEMSFDLAFNSHAHYTQDDLTFFTSLQTLFSSFYETEKVTREYSTLKNDIILSLLRTLELFDEQAGIHSMDVALIAQALGKKLELHEGLINDIYWAGIVHDIGKLGIDRTLLKKEGLYTVSDYEVMQDHAELSYQILSKSEELTSIANIVRHHHEWIDGSGYPDQIIDNEIPLAAKILHIAEATSIMMRDWSYQDALSNQEIIQELSDKKGSQFDSMCTDAMIILIQDSVLDEIKKTNRAD